MKLKTLLFKEIKSQNLIKEFILGNNFIILI